MPERKLTVFLVDDESIIRNGMKKLFDWESNGFTITGEAENGRDALPLILSLKPDIIITDLKMPFCDGITLASEIKKAMPSLWPTPRPSLLRSSIVTLIRSSFCILSSPVLFRLYVKKIFVICFRCL